MILKRNDGQKIVELESYIRQLEEFIDKFRAERNELAKKLKVIERRLKGLIQVYFPSRFKSDLTADECLAILSEELEYISELLSKMRNESKARMSTSVDGLIEERSKVYFRLDRLDNYLKNILSHVLLGYCTVNSLAKCLNLHSRDVKSYLSSLVDLGWLDVLKVKYLRRKQLFDIYFPSPHGLIACEKLLNASWTFVQADYLKKIGEYLSNEDLIENAKERLKHSHDHVVSVKDDSTKCLIRFSGGSHKADLWVDGKFVECESLSNDLDNTIRMVRALHEVQGEIIVIVSSVHAMRMMLQRLCLASWRLGFSLRVRISHINELSHLEAMRKFMIIRPPKRASG